MKAGRVMDSYVCSSTEGSVAGELYRALGQPVSVVRLFREGHQIIRLSCPTNVRNRWISGILRTLCINVER